MTPGSARTFLDTAVSLVKPSTLDESFPSARIRALVEQERVNDARQVMSFFVQMGVDVGGWSRALAPPDVGSLLPKTGLGDFHMNARWVEQNRQKYAGRWVALRMGELVDADPDRKLLIDRLRASAAPGGLLRWIEP